MTEAELIYKLKQGEESAFKELVLSSSSKLLTVARIYTSEKEEAKDVLQDAFIVVFEKIKKFEGSSLVSLLAWIKRILINIALNKNQKKYKKAESSIELNNMDYAAEEMILTQLSHDEIINLVMNLPDGYKQVFALNVIEGYSHREIGEKLGIKEASSRSQFLRARKILQKNICELSKVTIK